MEIIVEVTSERKTKGGRNPHDEVIEVNARRLLDWRKSGKGVRLGDNHYVGDKKIIVREFVVELQDYSDQDVTDYKKILEDNEVRGI